MRPLKVVFGIVLLVAVCTTGIPAVSGTSDDPVAAAELSKAEAMIDAGKLNEALSTLA